MFNTSARTGILAANTMALTESGLCLDAVHLPYLIWFN
jgi:hypothetical protein